MGRADYYADGQWNVECAFCGHKRKSSEVTLTWQGVWVCAEHPAQQRQPQDFVRAVIDDPSVPFVQPNLQRFGLMCTPNGSSAVPIQAEPGCAVPGYLNPAYNPESDI